MKTINIHTIGVVHYFHSTCWKDMPEEDVEAYERLMKAFDLTDPIYQSFDFNVIKFPVAGNQVSFVECPDFDIAPEPTVGKVLNMTLVGQGETLYKMRTYNNHVYHQKHLFVNSRYTRFNYTELEIYAEYMERAMKELGISKRLIGNKKYWKKIRTEVLLRALYLNQNDRRKL